MFHQGITVGGIPIPSREPWFLTIIAIHVAAGIIATAAGAVAMLSRKGPGRHPTAGTVYFWALVVIVGTISVLTIGGGRRIITWRCLASECQVGAPILRRLVFRPPPDHAIVRDIRISCNSLLQRFGHLTRAWSS